MENRKTDWLLIIAYILLSMIGLLMIYSASSFRLLTIGAQPSALFQRQLIFLVLSWALILTLQRVRVNILLGRPLAVGLIAFGVLTLFWGDSQWCSTLGIDRRFAISAFRDRECGDDFVFGTFFSGTESFASRHEKTIRLVADLLLIDSVST